MSPGIEETLTGGVFKTYKEKVLHILMCCISQMDDARALTQELRWCNHVIKNDFLQISNSMQNSTVNPVGGMVKGRPRRFSKTQRALAFDENVDAVVINNWVS